MCDAFSVCGDISNNAHRLTTNSENNWLSDKTIELWTSTEVNVGSQDWEVDLLKELSQSSHSIVKFMVTQSL